MCAGLGALAPTEGTGTVLSTIDGNPLLLFAAINPHELSKLIMKAIVREQPLSAVEHAERVKPLTSRITELSYFEAQLVEKNGGEHSVAAPPECILGVRSAFEENAAA
jgi:hypothetical protein